MTVLCMFTLEVPLPPNYKPLVIATGMILSISFSRSVNVLYTINININYTPLRAGLRDDMDMEMQGLNVHQPNDVETVLQ